MPVFDTASVVEIKTSPAVVLARLICSLMEYV